MRTALTLLCVIPATALAQQVPPPALQGPWTYQVQGRHAGKKISGKLTFEREGDAGVKLVGVLDQPGRLPARFTTSGTAMAMGWRFPLASVGLDDRLQGVSAAPAVELLVRRLEGDRVQGFLTEGGSPRGVFSGSRVRPPGQQCEPTADAWWARHAVATWEVGRSLVDFYKPGGGLDGLRGKIPPDQTAALRAALPGQGPWSPEAIYRAARARTGSSEAALRLSIGVLEDYPTLPLAPFPGIPADAPRQDKYVHWFASALMALRSNAKGSLWVGNLKEALDQTSHVFGQHDHGWDDLDIIADSQGAEFGQQLQCE